MPPVRVLHVLTAMNYAGTETLLMNLYRNIDRDVIQFDFAVSANQECAYDSEIISLGGNIYHYPRYKGTNHLAYVKWWKSFLSEHEEYHIVHGHIGSTAAIYLKIAKKMNRFTIAHSHSIKPSKSLHAFLYAIYSYPTRNMADFFFGCSKQAIIDRYGKKVADNPNISKVLNNAINAKMFSYSSSMRDAIRKEYNVSDEVVVLGTVGRITVPKNPYETIRICAELKKRGIDFVFWWFGEGELKEEVERALHNNGIQDRVRLLGVRSDIYNVLQGMDVFLFPSIWEGLGISCVEAQASGLPTICSDTIPQEAKVSDNCVFLKLNNTDLWCDSIENTIKMIKSPDYVRPNNYEAVKASGYDICESASELSEMYLKWSSYNE